MVPVAALIAVPDRRPRRRSTSPSSRGRRSARIIRFCADVMVGVPSILIGIFVFTFLVLPFKQFNAFAGSVALAVIMIPVVMRTTEEIAAPRPERAARGIARARRARVADRRCPSSCGPGCRASSPARCSPFARAMGETAPLLFTALGSRLVNVGDFGQADGRAAALHLRQRATADRRRSTSRPGARPSCCCSSSSSSTSRSGLGPGAADRLGWTG